MMDHLCEVPFTVCQHVSRPTNAVVYLQMYLTAGLYTYLTSSRASARSGNLSIVVYTAFFIQQGLLGFMRYSDPNIISLQLFYHGISQLGLLIFLHHFLRTRDNFVVLIIQCIGVISSVLIIVSPTHSFEYLALTYLSVLTMFWMKHNQTSDRIRFTRGNQHGDALFNLQLSGITGLLYMLSTIIFNGCQYFPLSDVVVHFCTMTFLRQLSIISVLLL